MPLLTVADLREGRARFSTYRRSVRLLLQFTLLFMLGVTGLWAYFSLNYSVPAAASGKPAATVAKSPALAKPNPTPANPKPAAQPAAAASGSTAAPVPACVPNSAYQPTAKLTLTQPDLQQVVDPPTSYAVYGSTATQVMSQIGRCTPVRSTSGRPGSFVASTGYSLNWQFDYASNGTGLCALNNIKVGLRISQVFPSWQPRGAATDLNSRWPSYIAKLQTYEAGHIQLDEAASGAVLSDLQNFPPTPCAGIVQAATAKANTDSAAYDAANANYDIVNNYGLNQDVVL